MKHFLPVLLVLLFIVGSSTSLKAQGSTTAAMSGYVTDETGEPLPGATVVAIHQPSGSRYGNTTNLDGFYRLNNMRVGGPYEITISFVGYEPLVKEAVYLQLGQTLPLDGQLESSYTELEEVVVLANQGAVIDGNRTGAETVVSEEEIDRLPTASRNLADFFRLTPQANLGETDDGPNISIAGQNNRFNSVFIDGAVNNDVFGLSGSGTNGGQTGISPISVDAIEQFQITVSPYDVTLGGFTGGGINAVTRSGTNNFEGSAYYFHRNEALAGETPTDDPDVERTELNDFTARTYGFRLGGPIIKDKLFFFTNVEIQRDEESQPTNLAQFRGEVFNNAETLDGLRDYVQENFGYDLGNWRDNRRERRGDKVLLKLDWNINQDHKISLRHSYTYAEETERSPSNAGQINFSNNAEFFPSTTNSTALEWRSNYGNNLTNKFILGITTVRDDRDFIGDPFPRVTLQDENFTQVVFGSEPFSVGNVLDQNVVTLTNNLTLYAGKHAITFGTHNEFYDIYNLFLRENFGRYTFDNASNFVTNGSLSFNDLFANGVEEYVRSYALQPVVDRDLGDDAAGIAGEFKAMQLGFYVQDEFALTERLKFNGGVRVDIPTFLDDPATNELFNQEALPRMDRFYDLDGARAGRAPETQLLFSPRFGFNWDVSGNRRYQIRGGLGIFTGRIPFVWPGGMFTNNGLYIASIDADVRDFPGGTLEFRPDYRNQYTGEFFGLEGNPSQIDLFEEDFRFPQVFRTSLAADITLPGNIIASFEGIYTKNINQIYYQNINVAPPNVVLGQFIGPDGSIQIAGPDNRPIYGTGIVERDEDGEAVAWGETDNIIDPRFDRVLLAKNTDEGYSYNLTASFTKPFSSGFTANVAYTFGRSYVLIDGTSSQNSSNWRNQEVIDRNDMRLGFSDFDPGHRVNAFVSYKQEWGDVAATTLSLFYNGQSGDPFSYVYNRGPSSLFGVTGARGIGGDDRAGRDFNWLVFVPADPSQINLIEYEDRDGNVISAAEQWSALNAYIENDDYLSDRRGQYAEMNGGRLPFEHILDLKFLQEFAVQVGETTNKLQLSIDIFNFGNLLNKDWGRRRFLNFGTLNLIDFEGYVDAENGDYRPEFTFDPTTEDPGDQASIDDTGIYSSRWQAQIGVRYIFGN